MTQIFLANPAPLFVPLLFLLSRYTLTHILLDNPAPLFFAVFAAGFLLTGRFAGSRSRQLRAVLALCGILSVAAYLAINCLNLFRTGMLWHDEANILSIAAAYMRGQPIYHALDAPDYYSLFYGPSTFLAYAPFFAANFSHSMPAIRVAGFAINILVLILLFIVLRVRLSWSGTLALIPIATSYLLAYPGVLLGMRGDTWLLLCMALALLSILKDEWTGWAGAAVISGVFSGLAIDFKATVIPTVCLLLAILYRRRGLRALIVSALSCTAATLGIFLLPRVSLPNYIAWLHISSHQRLLSSTFIVNMIAVSFLLGPIILIVLLGSGDRRTRLSGWVIPFWYAVAIAACIITGTKDGAGPWHLWPMLPLLLFATAYEVSLRTADSAPASNPGLLEQTAISARTLAVLTSIAIAGATVSVYFAVKDFGIFRTSEETHFPAREQAAASALDAILSRSFAQNLSMGYGATITDYRTDLRYKLPLARQEYFFDENSVVEGIKAGASMPASVTKRILGCEDIWIVPHGEPPFASTRVGLLPVVGTPYLFPDAIRLGFVKTHIPFERGEVYDLWKCPSDNVGAAP